MADTEKIIDYVTKREVRATPEEHIRQLFEHILVDDLGYPKENIGIEFTIQRGSNRKAEKADIVVFNDNRHTQENAYIVIEIESPTKNYDLQALSYVTATPAPYCVWFAGFEKNSKGPFYHYRDLRKDPTKFIAIPSLPRFGETQDTIGKYRKKDLKPAKALKILFRRIHHKLYGSGPIKREENVAKEVIKIIFCKIFDELSPDDLCEFRATPSEIATDEGKEKIRKRIESIYKTLQLDPDFGDLFADDPIEYDNEWVSYLVSELQGIALLHEQTNTDALGDAYEVFLPSTLKGESGQFFTPREVVRFAVQAINPSFEKKEILLDPACGSGGFLSIAIEHLRKQIVKVYAHRNFTHDKLQSILKDHAGKYIHGSDIEPLLYRIAKSYMAIVGDGKSNIYNFDSLEPMSRFPKGFTNKIKPNSVDVILTNPPFGTKIDDTRPFVLEQFDVGHVLDEGIPTAALLSGQDPDKLFLERCLQFLKPGGRMAIVLPRQNLSGAQQTVVEIRKWLLRKARLLGVVDLPRESFQPHTGTKTSLLFLQKESNVEDDYPIFMAVSDAVGHDRRGNPIFQKDEQGNILKDVETDQPVIYNDLPEILEQWQKYLNGQRVNLSNPSCFVINVSQIRNDKLLRMDAWYHDPNKNDLVKQLETALGDEIIEIDRLGDLAVDIFYPGRHKRNYVPESVDSLPFYSGTQILQVRPFDLKYQPKSSKVASSCIVEKDWVLITRSGSTGRVVIVNDFLAGSMVSEHVIRVICDKKQIDPYYLYAFLAGSKVGKVLMQKGIYASVVDHLTPYFIGSLPIPRLAPEKEKAIAKRVKDAENYRAKANSIFTETVNLLQNQILSQLNLKDIDLVDDETGDDD